MEILHLTKSFDAGGVTSVMLDIADAQAHRHDVVLASLAAGDWDTRARSTGLETIIGTPALIPRLSTADIIHVHHRRPATALSLSPFRGKVVEHIHNKFYDRRFASFRSRAMVAVSKEVADHVYRNFPHVCQTPEVVWNAVPNISAKPRGPREGPLKVLGVGRLDEQKNPLLFVAICEYLTDQLQPLSATWIGDGPLRTLVERAISSAGGPVSLQGWMPREDLQKLIANVDILLMTSEWEGLPMVALEALAAGTPVVTTDVGDLPEVLRKSGSGAVFLKGDEIGALASIRALADPHEWAQASAACQTTSARLFSFETMLQRWDRIYERVASEKGARE